MTGDAGLAPARTPQGVSFATALARHGDRPALVTASGTVSYDVLAARVEAERISLGATQRLVTLAPATTIDFCVSYLAALAGGHAVLLTHDDRVAAAYADATDLHPELRLLLSTSGSTGSPKLVRLSQDNLESNAAAIAEYLGLTAHDRALTTLPLDYCYGLSVLHSHLAAGASLVLTDLSVSDPAIWDLARAAGATSFAGVPYTFDLLDASGWPRLPTLRYVTQAGGRLAPDRVRAIAERGQREGFDLFVMYGQTEATARIAYLPPDLALDHPQAIGVAVPGGSLRIQGARDGVGELVYAGRNVMMGYAHSPADLARGSEVSDLRTGDLARVNDAGLVEIVGRRSRFAKIFGQRIDLDRVEALLAVEHVRAAAVQGEGERLVVAVEEGLDRLDHHDAHQLVARLAGLPPHAMVVVPVDRIPRRPNGKVAHQEVAALAGVATSSKVSTSSTTKVGEAIAAILRDTLGVPEIDERDTFVDLGGDSLSYVEVSLRLEEVLPDLPVDWPRRTVAELAALAAATDPRRRRWAKVETSILLRAAAIVAIVGSHANVFTLLGGAHILLAVTGANFARFLLPAHDPADRLRRVGRSVARVAVPSVIWIAAVSALVTPYPWQSILLLNDVLGGRHWTEPAFHYWFIEIVLLLAITIGGLLAIPAVAAFERAHRFALPAALLAVTLVPRWIVDALDYPGDIKHSSTFVAWLFIGGWAATVARDNRDRLVVSALLLSGITYFTGFYGRDLTIAAGVLALIWVPTITWPRALVRPTGVLASASLFIYLTHWQVYPLFEGLWPLGGLLASVTFGIAIWWATNRVIGFAHRVRRTPSKEQEAA